MAKEHDAEVLQRLISIEGKTDSMKDHLAWMVRANGPQLKAELIKAFGSGKRRVQVYLSLNRSRNVQDIAAHLGMASQNVTIELKWLMRAGLIDLASAGKRGNIYKKGFFDKLVQLSDALAVKFALDGEGKPAAKRRRR